MEITNLKINATKYFTDLDHPLHKQYLALRMFFAEGCSAEKVAAELGYSVNTVYSMVRDFKSKLPDSDGDPFFKDIKLGRKKLDQGGEVKQLIIAYRKKYLSVPDIKALLDAQNIKVSERYITTVLTENGFARLPRRDNQTRSSAFSNPAGEPVRAPKSKAMAFSKPEKFSSQLTGILLFLPILRLYGIDELIKNSDYPETGKISRLSSILSFLALKLSNVERYSMDDAWCMDRGVGMFAGLNVLPKTSWFSSYSSGITRDMNLSFLRSLHMVWLREGLLSDTANLDFTAIPYWGDDDPFENNWSGKRTKALASIQAVLAQDPDSGLLLYTDTTVRHRDEKDVVLEFLDFYSTGGEFASGLKYLVFDSKFTTYQNLNRLNQQGIKFVTIQRRSKKLEEKAASIPPSSWKNIRVMKANGKGRTVTVYEDTSSLTDYDGKIRQVFIAGKGKIKPAILITNDFSISLGDLIKKYSRRWLIEKDISEQIHFFHLNRNASGIVVKVDFDLVMTLLAHNLYRLFAKGIDGYSHCEAKTIFTKFIMNAGEVSVSKIKVAVGLKKKRTLPLIIDRFADYSSLSYPWLGNKKMIFSAANST
jgi:transposase